MKLHKVGHNIIISSVCLLSFACTDAGAAPKIIYKDIYNKHPAFNATKMPLAINGVIKKLETKKPNLYQVVVYKLKDHYLLYQLSGTEWTADKMRIDLDAQGQVKNISKVDEEDEGDDDDAIKKAQEEAAEAKCPDESVQFVAISAYPGVGGVDEAIATVANAAKQKYKTATILTEEANGQTYRNWFSCSNLKGFYSVGHGSNREIIVGNGDVINYHFFSAPSFVNKFKSTTVILNSCQIYNYPFGSEIMFGNAEEASQYTKNPGPNALEFIGGHTNLLMNASELSSACFMAQAIMGAKMDYDTLKLCIDKRDFHYQNFGISHPGKYFDQQA